MTSPLPISQRETIEKHLFLILNTLKHLVTGRIATMNQKIAISDPPHDHNVTSDHERSPAVFRQ